ncbi:hypothetical protein TNCV_2475141 [Trichonephila clavipes]|nr:hypothetical protein TNCV_2475141 [Trichonephila clavipes]
MLSGAESPQTFHQVERNDLTRDLGLSKEAVELLGSRLKETKLLTKGTSFYCADLRVIRADLLAPLEDPNLYPENLVKSSFSGHLRPMDKLALHVELVY